MIPGINLRIHCSHRSAIKLLAANAQSISKVSTIGNLVITNIALVIIKRRHLEKFNYSVIYNTIERQFLAMDSFKTNKSKDFYKFNVNLMRKSVLQIKVGLNTNQYIRVSCE